jgi:hypothetical protein
MAPVFVESKRAVRRHVSTHCTPFGLNRFYCDDRFLADAQQCGGQLHQQQSRLPCPGDRARPSALMRLRGTVATARVLYHKCYFQPRLSVNVSLAARPCARDDCTAVASRPCHHASRHAYISPVTPCMHGHGTPLQVVYRTHKTGTHSSTLGQLQGQRTG